MKVYITRERNLDGPDLKFQILLICS